MVRCPSFHESDQSYKQIRRRVTFQSFVKETGGGQGVFMPWPSFYMPPFFFLLFFFAIFRTVKSYDVYRCCIIHLRSQACSNNNRFPELDFRPSRFFGPLDSSEWSIS